MGNMGIQYNKNLRPKAATYYDQNSKDIQLSKSLSWLLRHSAVKEGLNLSPEGYLDVDAVLQHKSFRGFNRCDIERVVCNNEKQRFQLRVDPGTRSLQIKANQGHSISSVSDAELTPLLEAKYCTVVHGTYTKCWPQIKQSGLSRMRRRHIHLAKGSDDTIISGLRRDAQIHIYINLGKALKDGIKFFESENAVILTAGNDKGFLGTKYFDRVVQVASGFPPYTRPQDLAHAFCEFGNVKVDRIVSKMASLSFSSPEEAKAAIRASATVNIYGEFLTVKPFDSVLEKQRLQKRNPKDTPKSKEKAPTVDPATIPLTGEFHEQLDALLSAVRLSQQEILALGQLYRDLETVLHAIWPGCRAIPFGSVTTGLGVKSSDADCLVLLARGAAEGAVPRARRVLAAHPRLFAELVAIPRANTPIVKFLHVPTRTRCDLSFKTPLGAQNSRLVAFLLHADARLLPVAVVAKYWACVHGLTGTGRLTNYALALLVVFYLQARALLPPVEALQREPGAQFVVDGWDAGFLDAPAAAPRERDGASVADLLGGFFEFYSRFDFDGSVVCPFLGRPVPKAAFRDPARLPERFARYRANVASGAAPPLRADTPVVVQDPFEQCHNVAAPVSSRLAADLRAHFEFCARAYERARPTCADLLRTVLLERPKLPRDKTGPEYRVLLFPGDVGDVVAPDWRAAVREVLLQVFETALGLKLERLPADGAREAGPEKGEGADDPATVESRKPGANDRRKRRERESYAGTLTRAIWKRKQFSKLYGAMGLEFLAREEKITEEILNVDKNVIDVRFQLSMYFRTRRPCAVLQVRQLAGEPNPFRDFGSFLLSTLHRWFAVLFKPYCDPKKSAKKKKNPRKGATVKTDKRDAESDEDAVGVEPSEMVKRAPDETAETDSDSDTSYEDERIDPNAGPAVNHVDFDKTQSDSEKSPSDADKENVNHMPNSSVEKKVDFVSNTKADDEGEVDKTCSDMAPSNSEKNNHNSNDDIQNISGDETDEPRADCDKNNDKSLDGNLDVNMTQAGNDKTEHNDESTQMKLQ